jgi:bacteriorhodopsin
MINLVVSFIFSFIYPSFRVFFGVEILISLVAGFIYYLIINIFRSNPDINSVDWNKITNLRYVDWVITTPLLLVSISLFLSKGEKINNLGNLICKIIFFDLIMVFSGYLGTNHMINNTLGQIIGFSAYFMIFYLLYNKFFKEKKLSSFIQFKQILFSAMVILWFLYGVIYNFSNYNRNLSTNILDGISKGVFGLSLVTYLILHKK